MGDFWRGCDEVRWLSWQVSTRLKESCGMANAVDAVEEGEKRMGGGEGFKDLRI
jgi:hypothetical protein